MTIPQHRDDGDAAVLRKQYSSSMRCTMILLWRIIVKYVSWVDERDNDLAACELYPLYSR